MDKLKMQTQDLTDRNIEQIGMLFPNVITEIRDQNSDLKKAVDFDLLKQALSKNLVEGDDELYRLDWQGKKASLLKAGYKNIAKIGKERIRRAGQKILKELEKKDDPLDLGQDKIKLFLKIPALKMIKIESMLKSGLNGYHQKLKVTVI